MGSFLSTIGLSISANCNNKIKDELVTFEPNFYPGNRIEPTVHPRKGYLAILPDTWNKTEKPIVTKNEVWSVESCGDRGGLCVSSMKSGWEKYYIQVRQENDPVSLTHHYDINYSAAIS